MTSGLRGCQMETVKKKKRRRKKEKQCKFNILLFSFFKAFAASFTLISRGWNLLVKLWGTMTTSQLFSKQSSLNLSFSWPLKVSMITRAFSYSGYPFSRENCYNHLEIWKDNLLEKFNWFFGVWPVIFCVTACERAWKFKLW